MLLSMAGVPVQDPTRYTHDHIAPGWFRNRLAEIDPALFVLWDAVEQRWTLFRRSARGGEFFVWRIEDNEHGYRPLDHRVLWTLREADLWRHSTIRRYSRDWERRQDEDQARRQREMYNKLYAMTSDACASKSFMRDIQQLDGGDYYFKPKASPIYSIPRA